MNKVIHRHNRERGAILGIVTILLAVILAASAFAMWTLRGDIGGAGRDRLARQLFDCAEEGLAVGKNFFATTARTQWDSYLSTDVCASGNLPCQPAGPFPTGLTGPTIINYPNGAPYSSAVTSSGVLSTFRYYFAIYQNPSPAGIETRIADKDQAVMVYSICWDSVSHQSRAVQALLSSPTPAANGDYTGQAGHGFRNTNNAN
jgi:hypothetical protein